MYSSRRIAILVAFAAATLFAGDTLAAPKQRKLTLEYTLGPSSAHVGETTTFCLTVRNTNKNAFNTLEVGDSIVLLFPMGTTAHDLVNAPADVTGIFSPGGWGVAAIPGGVGFTVNVPFDVGAAGANDDTFAFTFEATLNSAEGACKAVVDQRIDKKRAKRISPRKVPAFDITKLPARTTPLGTITEVTPGAGLTGGGVAGPVQLDVEFGGTGLADTAARSDHVHPGGLGPRVVTVATSGGDFTDVQAAMDSIVDASLNKRYLLKIGPGRFPGPLEMKSGVDVEGSGQGATTIWSGGSPDAFTPTIKAASNAELRHLTVENTGGDQYAKAIRSSNRQPSLVHVTAIARDADYCVAIEIYTSEASRLEHVDAIASGATEYGYGVLLSGGDWALVDVTARADGDAVNFFNIGMLVADGADATLRDCVAEATGDDATNFGMLIQSADPVLHGVRASASGANGRNEGVQIATAFPTLHSVVSHASGAGSTNRGLFVYEGSVRAHACQFIAEGGTTDQGLSLSAFSGTHEVKITSSVLVGATSTVVMDNEFTVGIGASQLDGGMVFPGGGTLTCAGCFDENFVNAGGFDGIP